MEVQIKKEINIAHGEFKLAHVEGNDKLLLSDSLSNFILCSYDDIQDLEDIISRFKEYKNEEQMLLGKKFEQLGGNHGAKHG